MEEDLLLQHPIDRRLGNVNALPLGPPGVELEAGDSEINTTYKDSSSKSVSRRRSPSGSPPPKRDSSTRNRRSPSPVSRRRRSPSPPPRRNRFYNYSDRRRYDNRDRSRQMDRRRSPPPRDRRGNYGRNDRFHGGRGRSSSSRSRSMSPIRGRSSGMNRWSPKNKLGSSPSPSSGIVQQQPPMQSVMTQQVPTNQGSVQGQYNVMAPQMYGDFGGGAYNHQYSVPPPQTGFPPQADVYGISGAGGSAFNAGYPPPTAWSVNDAYGQQQWLPPGITDASQIARMQQPQPGPIQVPAPTITTQALNALSDAAPGTIEPKFGHDAAVAQEAENQREELKKQRASYLKKTSVLKKELRMLREQRKDFNTSGSPPSPTSQGFIDENEKLQNQIVKKLSTIENVIDMLAGIIGEDLRRNRQSSDADLIESRSDIERENSIRHNDDDNINELVRGTAVHRSRNKLSRKLSSSVTSTGTSSSTSVSSSNSEGEGKDDDDDSSPERLKNKVMESMKQKQKEAALTKNDGGGGTAKSIKPKMTALETDEPSQTAMPKFPQIKEIKQPIEETKRFNYVFYDPEMHWCQTCDVFPKTAKDFLNHLHTKEHMDRESIETPWHSDMISDQYPNYDDAPTKRIPIRGLGFFVPATAWFCKLCNIWMGDLHCASTHLKSQIHSNKYNTFLEKNPHFEMNWLADRQHVLDKQREPQIAPAPIPPAPIVSIKPIENEQNVKKVVKEDEKNSKKHKKRRISDKKEKRDKKKKKRSKKRKRGSSTSSASSDSSASSESDMKNKSNNSISKNQNNVETEEVVESNPVSSIRVSMRKQENPFAKEPDVEGPIYQAPPPPIIAKPSKEESTTRSTRWGDFAGTATIAGPVPPPAPVLKPLVNDETTTQQWNNAPTIITDNEKKIIEQLKGKIKGNSRDDNSQTIGGSVLAVHNVFDAIDKENQEKQNASRKRDAGRTKRTGRSRSKSRGGPVNVGDSVGGGTVSAARSRSRSRTRSRTRSRSRSRNRNFRRGGGGNGGGGGGGGRRSRSRSRVGRNHQPAFWGRQRRRRSRSRSLKRRSRSRDRRRRFSRSRTRSRSSSRHRIEKAVVKVFEFRPRVPEKEKEKEKPKDKKDATKKSKTVSTSTVSATNVMVGKKLPFIGKMPVFKKQTAGMDGIDGEQKFVEYDGGLAFQNSGVYGPLPPQRPPAPTAVQIQMAMMEDAYGNAPPFHPDAAMMVVDYDDLMPDPVQFVNLMGPVPPPPPPTHGETDQLKTEIENDDQMLPPGIDETESEEFVPKPMVDGPVSSKDGTLPKDLEEALNIIFPGEKKPDETLSDEQSVRSKGETQIIVDEPVMQADDLVKEGIHLVSIEETSLIGMDDGSQISMNEPLIFNQMQPITQTQTSQPTQSTQSSNSTILIQQSQLSKLSQGSESRDHHSKESQMTETNKFHPQPPPPPPPPAEGRPISNGTPKINNIESGTEITTELSPSSKIPQTSDNQNQKDVNEFEGMYDLDDIPEPPPSPTESEKVRRQEELDDLAMLGIDADDMAAQCF